MHNPVRLLAAFLMLINASCARPPATERATACALDQLPRYRACIQRVATDAKQCEDGYRFRAKLWCQKKHATVEATAADIASHAYICGDTPLDSPRCKQNVERLLELDCERHVWSGVEAWTAPQPYDVCRTGQTCCAEPAAKANADCDQAAANAIHQCGAAGQKK